MRILILADDCNPQWPSLPVVGYKYAKAISEHAEIVVATQIRNKENIELEGFGNADVVYIDSEVIAAPLFKVAVFLRGGNEVGWTMQMAMNYPSYLYFEWKVWQHFKEDLHDGNFDIVHRITPMTPTLPSFLASRSPVPFVLGPLNGHLHWPKFFVEEKKREKEWLSNLRGAYKYLPYYRSTYSKAAAVLASFEHTISDLPPQVKDKTINFPEVGIDPELFSMNESISNQNSLSDGIKILFVGRLVPYKLPEVIVRAFADSTILQKHKLQIVGEGPERKRLERIIETNENIEADCIEFIGSVDQVEVGNLMRQADIFAFPSIRELGAGVVLEAMACGLTCVVVDYGGPSTLVSEERGIKIPISNIENLVISFREALEYLVNNPEKIKILGDKAYEHAMNHYTWQVKAMKTIKIYNWVLGSEKDKPGFWDK